MEGVAWIRHRRNSCDLVPLKVAPIIQECPSPRAGRALPHDDGASQRPKVAARKLPLLHSWVTIRNDLHRLHPVGAMEDFPDARALKRRKKSSRILGQSQGCGGAVAFSASMRAGASSTAPWEPP